MVVVFCMCVCYDEHFSVHVGLAAALPVGWHRRYYKYYIKFVSASLKEEQSARARVKEMRRLYFYYEVMVKFQFTMHLRVYSVYMYMFFTSFIQ